MGKTVAGGVYRDARGDGYHNAHGKPVNKSGVLLTEVAKATEKAAQQAAAETNLEVEDDTTDAGDAAKKGAR